jgi:DNA-binding FadR family transcriptional regulator
MTSSTREAQPDARFTYQRLVELVEGDHELIARLVEEGLIERRGGDRVLVDVDRVLLVRTLWRELEIDWPGVEVILHLREALDAARARIAELEQSAPPAEG